MASSAQAKEFIARIAPIIQEEARARGYKVCSPIIAQACIESGFDTSLLAYKFHNYFGMKCGSSWKGKSVNMKTKEEINSALVSIRDNFRAYPDMISGVRGYFDFINTKRYANLLSARTPKEYLEFIKKDGYATSSTYVSTCMNCIGKYDLTKWDEAQSNPYKLSASTMREGSKGDSVAWLQWELRNLGYDIKVDGIYGAKTKETVMDFQRKKFVDGIVGAMTINALKNNKQ